METTKSIKGTRTEHNLLASFAGESQAAAIHFLQKRPRKKAMSRLPLSFSKPPSRN